MCQTVLYISRLGITTPLNFSRLDIHTFTFEMDLDPSDGKLESFILSQTQTFLKAAGSERLYCSLCYVELNNYPSVVRRHITSSNHIKRADPSVVLEVHTEDDLSERHYYPDSPISVEEDPEGRKEDENVLQRENFTHIDICVNGDCMTFEQMENDDQFKQLEDDQIAKEWDVICRKQGSYARSAR